jgi:hypothetical protein
MTKFDQNHISNGVLCEDMIKKMTDLPDPLLNAKVKETKATQIF